MPYRRSCGATTPPRAVLFDFNGTISDDEPVLARIFARMFAEIGIEVSEALYFAEFAGYSDPEIVERVLDRSGRPARRGRAPDRTPLRALFRGDRARPPIRPRSARFVREVAARVPVAIASGAAGAEIEAVLVGAELRELFDVIVAAEDVTRGKPDPEGYECALALVNAGLRQPVAAADVLVFEDIHHRASSRRAAGMRCVGVGATCRPTGSTPGPMR